THSAFAETALVKLAAPGLFNDVGCKRCPHEFLLLVRKAGPARLDGLPRRIECGEENGHDLRIKDAGLYVTVEEVAHFARPGFMLGARSAPYISSGAGAWSKYRMALRTREIYRSPNGNRWSLALDIETGRVFVTGTSPTCPQAVKSPISRSEPFSSRPATDQRSRNFCV